MVPKPRADKTGKVVKSSPPTLVSDGNDRVFS